MQRLFLSETVALRVSCLFAVTPLPVKMRLERSAELVRAKPFHLLAQTALPLKSPTGALIASLCAAALFESHWTPHQIKKSAVAMQQRIFWWGAQWDSNPRSPDPQSGALTDYAMGTTSMRPKGLEPPAHCLEGSCSIHLSYGRTLLSQWVPLWRQFCVGTGCERNNTIPIAFCQGKSEKSFNFFALRAKMTVPACRNGLTAATFRHSPAQSPVQSRTPRPAHDAPP